MTYETYTCFSSVEEAAKAVVFAEGQLLPLEAFDQIGL